MQINTKPLFTRKNGLVFLGCVNYFLLFYTHPLISPTLLSKLFLFFLNLYGLYTVFHQDTPAMKKYTGKSAKAALCAISFYAAFATFGQRFFLGGNTRPHFSFVGVVYLFLGMLFYLPLLWLFLSTLERASQRIAVPQGTRLDSRRAYWVLFGCLGAVQIVIFLFFAPGGFPHDAIIQLRQMSGIEPFDDWHPVMHTLIEMLIIRVLHNAGAIVLIQQLCFALLLTSALMFGYRAGMRLSHLCIMGVLFEGLPNQVLSWNNALKDFPYTLALLWGCLLLLHLVVNDAWSKRLSFALCMGIDLFLIAALRHNGIIPFAMIILVLALFTIRRFERTGFRMVISAVLALVLLIGYKGPLFSALHVTANGQSLYTTMLCAVGSCINKDLPLSEESEEIMSTVIPLSDWKEYYGRFYGHDLYYWGRSEDAEPYRTEQITARDAFTVYLEALRKYPDVIIKDRIDGADLMWDVVQPKDSFNVRSTPYVELDDIAEDFFDISRLERKGYGGYEGYRWNLITKIYIRSTEFPTNSVYDVVIWRCGIYLIALMALFLFWKKNDMSRIAWITVPMLGNVLSLVFLLFHQSFRYIYFIQVTVVFLIFFSIALRNGMSGSDSAESKA